VAEVTVRDGLVRATLADRSTDTSLLPNRLIGGGIALRGMREEEINLETAFLELTKGSLGRQPDGARKGWGKLEDQPVE
jgi:ABC-2 type transport system ATP-binding protein